MGYDSHLILGQRSGLVGTDDGSGPHRFTGMELAHQVVLTQHTPHAQRQADRHAHRQPLRYGHHYQGDGQHDGAQGELSDFKPRVVVGRITVKKEEINHAAYHNQDGQDEADA